MASVASQLIEEVTAHAQSDSQEDARETCADGTYIPSNLRIINNLWTKNETLPLKRTVFLYKTLPIKIHIVILYNLQLKY